MLLISHSRKKYIFWSNTGPWWVFWSLSQAKCDTRRGTPSIGCQSITMNTPGATLGTTVQLTACFSARFGAQSLKEWGNIAIHWTTMIPPFWKKYITQSRIHTLHFIISWMLLKKFQYYCIYLSIFTCTHPYYHTNWQWTQIISYELENQNNG